MTFGGVNGKQEPVDTVEIYDVDKKEWEGSDVVDTMRERVLGLSAVLRGQCSIFFGLCSYILSNISLQSENTP